MKKYLILLLVGFSTASCNKDSNGGSVNSSCTWFPIGNGIVFNYNRCVIGKNTPSQIKCYDFNPVVTDSLFFVGEIRLSLRSCNAKKIYYTQGSLARNVLLIDDSAPSQNTEIFNDGVYSVYQYKDAANFIYSTATNIKDQGGIMVKFIPGKGFYTLTTFTSDEIGDQYTLK